MHPDKTKILLFDGACNLCSGIMQFIRKRDPERIFRLVPLQSESGQAWLKKFDLPVNDFKSLVYIKDGKRYLLRSTAVLHVLKDLGGIWKLAYGFIILPESWRDIIYNLIAKTRYILFGKGINCITE
jgi:predicted DCC family thiol-disulfide oxidoreductase YuxK